MTITLEIQGMSCQHCVNRVKKTIEALSGIVQSDVQIGKADITLDTNRITPDAIRQAIEDAGYPVTVTR